MSLLRTTEFWRRLREGRRFLADGAIGTEIMKIGVPAHAILQANRGYSDNIRTLHSDYLEAGARILTTNTFGDYSARTVREDFRSGISNALFAASAATEDTAVWISVTSQALIDHPELHSLIANSYTSMAVLIETCTDISLAVRAVKTVRPLMPDMIAVTCHFEEDGELMDGTSLEAVVSALERAGVDLIGANCGNNPDVICVVAECMRSLTQTPLLVQPGAGLPIADDAGNWRYPLEPDEFAEVALRLYEAGVNIVGGCCGTTPAHIKAVHQKCSHFLRR